MAKQSLLKLVGQLHVTVKFAALSCILLIFLTYIVFTQATGLGAALMFVVALPLLSIPVGLCCLVGAVISAKAFICEDDFQVARIGFRGFVLSVVFPLIVIAVYAVCLALIIWAEN